MFAAGDNVRPMRLPRARTPAQQENCMAKKVKKSKKRVAWSRAHHAELRKHSKAKTPVKSKSKSSSKSRGK